MTMKPMIVQISPAMPSQVSGRSCHSGRVPATLRCSLIFTPHAHRKKATVGAITRTKTRRMMRSMALTAVQDEVQILEHARRRPPDVAITIGHGVVAPLAALPGAAVDAVVLFVEEVRQGDLEHIGDLARVCMDGESRRDDAHHRRDLVAPARPIGGS